MRLISLDNGKRKNLGLPNVNKEEEELSEFLITAQTHVSYLYNQYRIVISLDTRLVMALHLFSISMRVNWFEFEFDLRSPSSRSMNDLLSGTILFQLLGSICQVGWVFFHLTSFLASTLSSNSAQCSTDSITTLILVHTTRTTSVFDHFSPRYWSSKPC